MAARLPSWSRRPACSSSARSRRAACSAKEASVVVEGNRLAVDLGQGVHRGALLRLLLGAAPGAGVRVAADDGGDLGALAVVGALLVQHDVLRRGVELALGDLLQERLEVAVGLALGDRLDL